MKYVLIFLILFSSLAFAQTKDDFKDIPGDKKREESKEKILKSLRKGMTKKELYKLFGKYYKRGYKKEGNEEWITFRDWIKGGTKTVTVYLKNGKVQSWKEEEIKNEIPEI